MELESGGMNGNGVRKRETVKLLRRETYRGRKKQEAVLEEAVQ